MKFDWYQATISDSPMRVLQQIGKLGDEIRPNDRVGKMYRYTQGFEIHKAGHVVACVAMGGQGEGSAHAWATSDNAPPFADLVRNEWPEAHAVTRLDACEDFIDGTAFRRLCGVGRKVAKAHRVRFPSVSDELNPTAGRTQYLGAPSSEYRGRIYEKGWEVITKARGGALRAEEGACESIRVPGIDRDCHPSEWVRMELQARPKDRIARVLAASATPEQVWTFTGWAHDLAREALALQLERFYIRQRKHTTDERALRFMCGQYGKMLSRLHADLGDWSCVGLQIGEVLAELERERRT